MCWLDDRNNRGNVGRCLAWYDTWYIARFLAWYTRGITWDVTWCARSTSAIIQSVRPQTVWLPVIKPLPDSILGNVGAIFSFAIVALLSDAKALLIGHARCLGFLQIIIGWFAAFLVRCFLPDSFQIRPASR